MPVFKKKKGDKDTYIFICLISAVNKTLDKYRRKDI